MSVELLGLLLGVYFYFNRKPVFQKKLGVRGYVWYYVRMARLSSRDICPLKEQFNERIFKPTANELGHVFWFFFS